jgi:hypothetical protein
MVDVHSTEGLFVPEGNTDGGPVASCHLEGLPNVAIPFITVTGVLDAGQAQQIGMGLMSQLTAATQNGQDTFVVTDFRGMTSYQVPQGSREELLFRASFPRWKADVVLLDPSYGDIKLLEKYELYRNLSGLTDQPDSEFRDRFSNYRLPDAATMSPQEWEDTVSEHIAQLAAVNRDVHIFAYTSDQLSAAKFITIYQSVMASLPPANTL